ncbi:MAG: efflux RND transporter periplasmic adaptor subunit [Isosphaeraceae bacterium]
MSSNLRDELASLRIERFERGKPKADFGPRERKSREKVRGEGGWGFLSWIVWLVPLSALAGAGTIAYKQFDALKPKIEVSVAQVQSMTTGEKEKVLSAKGYVKSRQIAMIGAKKVGRIAEIRFEEGQRVKRGDILAVLEHDELDAQLDSRKATVERTQSELNEAEAELTEKDAKLKRWSRLYGQKQVSIDEYESTLTTFRKSRARVEALRSAMKLMTSMVRETEETVQDMTILAPFDGTVLTKEAEVGDTINPGPSSTTGRGSIATLADLARLDVETDVAESLLGRVRLGQNAEINVNALSDRRFRGRVRKILPLGDRARETVKVKVQIDDPGDGIFPELVANVNFLPEKSVERSDLGKSYLYVPRNAIVEDPAGAFVWVVVAKSQVEKRAIKFSGDSRDESARVDSGLKSGDTVVLNPPRSLRDRETVKIAE